MIFVEEKYGEQGLQEYFKIVAEVLFRDKKTKLRKLKMQESEIPEGFY